MRNKLLGLLSVLVFTALFAVPKAHADTFDFNSIGPLNTDIGHSGTVTGSGGSLTITAYGFWVGPPVSDADIFNKSSGTGEQGLGIYGDPFYSNEISAADFITLDMSGLGGITSATLYVGSVQDSESFYVCTSDTLGVLGTCGPEIIGNGSNNGIVVLPITWTSNDPYVSITGGSHDVLVMNGLETVPEPGTLALFGTGLLGMAGFLRRKLGV
jgi:hypothetical protein